LVTGEEEEEVMGLVSGDRMSLGLLIPKFPPSSPGADYFPTSGKSSIKPKTKDKNGGLLLSFSF